MTGSGGAAAAAGIDFQQRIAALVMLHMLSRVRNLAALQLGDDVDITAIGFETEDAIDDLVLTTPKGRVLIQAKRTISLSSDPGSDFASVIGQFTRQLIRGGTSGDVFLLATSSRSSRRITTELRRITDAARFHEEASKTTPLTASEAETLAKTEQLFSHFYRSATGQAPSSTTFWNLLRKMRVAIVDIEAGSPLEAAALTLLSSRSELQPSVVWGALIALAISLAKDRHAIDNVALETRMGSLLQRTAPSETQSLMPLTFENDGYVSAGRDVVLVKSFLEDADYLVIELYRFNPDGTRRYRFADDHIYLANGHTSQVLRRTATMVGMERFLRNQSALLQNARLLVLPMSGSEAVEDGPFVLAHQARCRALLMQHAQSLKCVRCGDPVSESLAPTVEIDADETNLLVGLCHEECVCPTDRIVGGMRSDFFAENPALKNFDYNKWFVLVPRGQCGVRFAAQLPGVKPMLWNPSFSYSQAGQWCVRIDLTDGSARYACERGRVLRSGQQEAERKAMTFNESFASAKAEGDPWCYTSVTEAFTTRNQAMKHCGATEACLECVQATAVRYSASVGSAYSNVDGYYAPLVMLVHKERGRPLVFDSALFLLTDPLNLDVYLENWRNAGLDLPEFVAAIVETDPEFDTLVRQLEEQEMVVFVDPMLAQTGELISGGIVRNMDNMIREPMESNALRDQK